jgi:hypothetical protein
MTIQEKAAVGLRAPHPRRCCVCSGCVGLRAPHPRAGARPCETRWGLTPPRPPNSDRLVNPGFRARCPYISDAWGAPVGRYLKTQQKTLLCHHTNLALHKTARDGARAWPSKRSPAQKSPACGGQGGRSSPAGVPGAGPWRGARGAAPASAIFPLRKRGAGRSARTESSHDERGSARCPLLGEDQQLAWAVVAQP